jgi:predicted O-methyltransferase YrrM
MRRPVRLEELADEADGRRRSPSAARNRAEILPVLREALADAREVLEIACGTGEHAVHFARALPQLSWQPTDRDEEALRSCRAWWAHAQLPNLREPRPLDVEAADWGLAEVDAVVAINFLHITPWSACRALLAGAARVLRPGGLVFVYGAMFRSGHEREPSNLEFDRRLRTEDPAFGVRELEALLEVAASHGLAPGAVLEMPHRNLVVTMRQTVRGA